MKVLDCRVRWREGLENSPELEFLVDKIPENSELRYESKEGLYYAELDGYVNFIYKENPNIPDEGFGGARRSITLTSGETISFNGGWSSRAGVANSLGFKECLDIVITDNLKTWKVGYSLYSGNITYELAKKAVEDYIPDVWLEKKTYPDNNEYIYIPQRTENPCEVCKGIREYESPFSGKMEKCNRCLETGHKLFESIVYHRTNSKELDIPFFEVDEDLKWHISGSQKGFEEVATVLCNDLDLVYRLTQHIDETWWESNADVIIQKDGEVNILYTDKNVEGFKRKAKDLINVRHGYQEEPKHRSTSIGDVIVLEDNTVWQCAQLGWEQVPITKDPKYRG